MKAICAILVLSFAISVSAQEHKSDCEVLLEKTLEFAEKALERWDAIVKSGKLTCKDAKDMYELQKEGGVFGVESRAACSQDIFRQGSCDAVCFGRRIAEAKKTRDRAC